MATRRLLDGLRNNKFTTRYNAILDTGFDPNEHSIEQTPIQSTPCEIAMQTLADDTLNELSSNMNEDSLNLMVGSTP